MTQRGQPQPQSLKAIGTVLFALITLPVVFFISSLHELSANSCSQATDIKTKLTIAANVLPEYFKSVFLISAAPFFILSIIIAIRISIRGWTAEHVYWATAGAVAALWIPHFIYNIIEVRDFASVYSVCHPNAGEYGWGFVFGIFAFLLPDALLPLFGWFSGRLVFFVSDRRSLIRAVLTIAALALLYFALLQILFHA